MITLNFGKSKYQYKPTRDLVEFPDMIIKIPTIGSLSKAYERTERTIEYKRTPIVWGVLDGQSRRPFVHISFSHLPDPNYREEIEYILWVEERWEWVNISYETWREDVYDDESYSGPYELNEYLEKMLITAYGITWPCSAHLGKHSAPIDFLTEIILHSISSGSNTLNLTNLAIDVLPLEIGMLVDLEDLDLSNNRLTEIPEEIGKLTSLRSLNLSNNQLKSLHLQIFELDNLRYLDIRGNPIPVIPKEIAHLSRLEKFIT